MLNKQKERLSFHSECEEILQEQIIETYPLIRLIHQKSKTRQEQGKQPKSELKIRTKVLNQATRDLSLRLCE